MIPWADILIILIILLAAYIGYIKGLIGTIKGIVGSLTGLVAAWLLTPLAAAWAEGVFGLESKLAAFLVGRLPEPLTTIIYSMAEAAGTLQEIKEGIMELPLPPEMVLYMGQALTKAPVEQVPSGEVVIQYMMKDIAQHIFWAAIFFLIWWGVALLVRGFLGLLTNTGSLNALSQVDGLLGIIGYTIITVAVLIILSGLFYPMMLLSNNTGSGISAYLLDSRLVAWLAGIYQFYIVPWLA